MTEDERLIIEIDVLEVIEEALENELDASDPEWADGLTMVLPDGTVVSVSITVTLP